ncbi:MAG: M48 family metalloprotease [Phycisphaerales bacterium]|nr:MAG: M48 family metalloprotease [Phycisphaerales bacterium]
MATLENLLSPALVERLGWTLIHFVWQAAAVALLLTLLFRTLHRRSANVRYLVACLALVLIAALPLVTMALVEVSEPAAEAGPGSVPLPALEATPAEVIEVAELPAMSFDASPVEMADVTVHVPWTQRAAAALEPALPYLVLGWLLGVFGLSAWHLGGWAQLLRLKRRMVGELAAPLQAKLTDLAAALGIKRAVALLESALVEVPTVVGWIKPVILLPASALSGLSAEQLEAILAHELAHIRRYDYLVNIAQTVIEILGFYHPALWWVSHKIRAERENCCDDLAVQVCGDSVRYARALTCLEEMRHHRSELAVAASGGSLVARIGRLLGRPAPTRSRFTWLPGLIALLLVAAAIIPTALVLAAPDVSPVVGSTFSDLEPTSDRLVTSATAQTRTEADSRDETKIVIDCMFATVLAEKVLDHETALVIQVLLEAERQGLDEAVTINSEHSVTLGELLRAYVVRQPLTPATIEALVDLLAARGYLTVESRPQVLTPNNNPAEIIVMSEEYFILSEDPSASAQAIELGTFVQTTPHFSPAAADRIRLEIAAKWTESVGETQAGEPPAVHTTEIASTVTLPRDRFFALLIEPDDTGGTPSTDRESKLILFRADCDEPPAEQPRTSAAPAPQSERHPRQVLLDVQIVEMDQANLTDLSLEWGAPQISAGSFGTAETSNWPAGVQIGYTPDRAYTAAIHAALRQLRNEGRAKLLSQPQIAALDGRQARLTIGTEEWFSIRPQATADDPETQPELVRVASGKILSATPRINDNDEITLEIAVEYSDTIPPDVPAELPVVTRRTSRNVVTIQDGGTVALAGLSAQNANAQEQIVILVTASLAPEISAASRPREASLALSATEPTTISAPMPAQESSEPAAVTRLEFVNNDPIVRAMLQTMAQIEIDVIMAQPKFGPEHPEIVQKKQLLESLNDRLAQRRRELEQQYDAGTTPTATPGDPAQRRADAEKVLEILREELARIEEGIRETRAAWYPEKEEAARARQLERLIRFQETLKKQCEEIARLVDEQVAADGGYQTEPSNLEAREAERVFFWHTDANGSTDRRFGFSELIGSEDGHWILANPWMTLVTGEMRCHITADQADVKLDLELSPPFPSDMTFWGHVVVNITPLEPNGADACVLYVDELTYDREKGRLASSGPARSVCGGTEFVGRGLELYSGPAPTRPTGDRVKTIEGVELYLGPSNSFVVALSNGQPERSEPGESTQLRVLTETTDDTASLLDAETQIIVDLSVLTVPTDRPLTPEAAARLSSLWDQMAAKRGTERPERAALPGAKELQIPARELLDRCAEDGQRDSDALETMTDLLASLEYVHVALNPRVEVVNGQRAEIRSTQHVPDPTAELGTSEMVECSTILKVTPQADNAGRMALDVAAEITDLIPSNGTGERPRIGKYSLNTNAVVSKGKTLVLRLEPTTEGEVQGSDVLYLLVRPHIVPPKPATGEETPATRAYDSVTATFLGEDLRRALEEVAMQGGANIMYDANVDGKVWAKLQDVPVEKALEIVLAGSPYIAKKMPYGYAITKGEEPPAEPSSQKENAVQVEARFVLVDNALMKALRDGLPIKGVTSPGDANALHVIGGEIAAGETPLLEEAQVGLLLKAIRSYTDSRALAAPRVTVPDGEAATLSLTEKLDYVGGYGEPNDAAQEAIPQHKSKTLGLTFDVTPHLLESHDSIRLQFQTEITVLVEMHKALYEGKYEYDVPSFETVTVHTEIVVPDGQTAMVDGGEMRSPGRAPPEKDRPARPLLILVTPARSSATPPESAPLMMDSRRPGDPGMGAFAPGSPPWPTN